MSAAHDVLREMAEQLHAFVGPESEARASDERWREDLEPIQPHVLGPARHDLLNAGILHADHHATRGGRQILTYRLRDLTGRERATEDVAARKRLLYARYLGWASGTRTERGLIGPAAERMVHQTLRDVSPDMGYRLESPARGEAPTFLGEVVPGGPLDNAAHLHLGDQAVQYSIAIEVKSRRDWVYPTSADLYQVLYKAAALQRALPNAHIVPMLVCRRAHVTAYRMMGDLGGYLVDVRQQWLPRIPSRTGEDELLEVRNELFFQDLVWAPDTWIHQFLRRHLSTHLPGVLPRQADRWRESGHRFEAEYQELLREGPLTNLARIREGASGDAWHQGGW